MIDEAEFKRQDWITSEFGHIGSEDMPSNMPEPRGLGFTSRAYVDANHA